MNQLEKAILAGAVIAQKEHTEMTGCWLSHGPEYFITCAVAKYVSKVNGFSVFPEASPKKIKKEREEKAKRGPLPKVDSKRFDIVIWQKTYDDVRAIIEIKRAYNVTPLKKDRKKICDYMAKNDFVKNGYLLAYTEAKGDNTLAKRLGYWEETLGSTLVGSKMGKEDNEEWKWVIALFKV